MDYLDEYWHMRHYDDKAIKFKIFKANLANCSNSIDKELFAEIFGYPLVTLANNLIYTTNNEENKIIVNSIKKNKDKLYEPDDFHNFVIEPGYKRADLIDATKLILQFNETIQLDKIITNIM